MLATSYLILYYIILHLNILIPILKLLASTVIFLSFRTDRSGQTVQTQIRLLITL